MGKSQNRWVFIFLFTGGGKIIIIIIEVRIWGERTKQEKEGGVLEHHSTSGIKGVMMSLKNLANGGAGSDP